MRSSILLSSIIIATAIRQNFSLDRTTTIFIVIFFVWAFLFDIIEFINNKPNSNN